MEKVRNLLTELREQQIKLILKGNDLEIVSFEKQIQASQIEKIKALKAEIISYLKFNELNDSIASAPIPVIESGLESYPISNAQYRMWVVSQMEEGSIAYNMSNSMYLNGSYKIEHFKEAICSVVKRHEILRTVFKQDENGEVRQYISDSDSFEFSIEYVDYRKEKNPEESAESYALKNSTAQFNLETGPLLRACLLQLSDDLYMFYFNMHHIVGDRWSLDVLATEVIKYYNALEKGVSPNIPPLKLQYKDYSAWQLSQLEKDTDEVYKNYWLDRFKGEVSALDLPSKKIRPKIKTFRGGNICTRIPLDVLSKLQDFTTNNGGTLFTGLLSAWKVLLYRYTGETDIVIGNPLAGRNHPDLENQIGFYTSILALRNKINPENNFSEVYNQVKLNSIEDYKYQLYPFDTLTDDLNIKRDPSRNPLFDILVDFHGNAVSNIDFEGNEEFLYKGDCMVKFDIELHLTVIEEGVDIEVNYNTDIYEQSMIKQLLIHYKNLLKELLYHPEKQICKASYLTEEEEHELLNDFNLNTVEYPKGKTVLDLFLEQTEIKPDAIAVEFKDTKLTYKELDNKSNQLAYYLLNEYNLKGGERIGIHLPRNEQYIISILGILKAGGSYVPLDTSYPLDRKRYVIEDAEIGLIVTDTAFMFELEFFEGQLCAIDIELDSIDTNQLRINRAVSSNPAYLIYTSGSTGNPKGVIINHSNLYVSTLSRNAYYDNVESFLLIPSFSFDSSVAVIWESLTRGGCMFLLGDEDLKDFLFIENLLKKDKLESILCVPSYYKVLLEQLGANLTFKRVILAGEALGTDLVKEHYDLFPGTQLFNEYGPTENTVWATVALVEKDTDLVTIGKPINHTNVYILDNNQNIVPKGVIGEMYLGGDGVSQGYLNRAELTAEKFIPNPFKEGTRLYKTGDLGRWLPDGNIEFLGRTDHQVKIRGYRIELGEIETVLDQIKEIEKAVVITNKDNFDSNQLVAYIVCNERLDHSSIRQMLKDKLPEYMIPNTYVSLDEMPLNRNGKIDRNALPEPNQAGQVSEEYIAPSTPVEEKIANIWSAILNIEKMGIQDDFFELGGSSLSAIKLIGQYNKVFNKRVTINEIFANPILKSHVELLDLSKEEVFEEIVKVEESESYPVSNSQLRLWLASKFEGGSSLTYNIQNTVELDGSYDIDCFQKAIYSVIERHEILRTVFKTDESGELKQFVLSLDELNFDIESLDYSNLENPLDACMAYVEQDALKPFSLSEGPLFRVSLLKLGSEQYVFYYNMHHIISDEWSMAVLSKDVMMFYDAYQSESFEIPALNIQYKDYACWQLDKLNSESYKVHKEYWLDRLSGELPVVDLPSYKIRPAVKTNTGKNLGTYLSKELTAKINEFVDSNDGSLFMLFLSAINVLIHKYTSNNDIIIGSPFGGRSHPDLENQIGFYINNLALRNHIDSNESFLDFYKSVKERTLEDFVHQEYPLDKVVESLGIKYDQSRTTLYDVSFTLHDAIEDADFDNRAGTLYGVIEESELFVSTKNDVEFHITPLNDIASFQINFNPDVYEEEMISTMMLHFEQLLSSLLNAPNKSIGEVNYLTESESDELINKFNSTAKEYQLDKTFLDLFNEQAAKTPNAKAISFKDTAFSYEQLHNLSNQLAHCLVNEYGVTKGDIIGIQLDRNEWLIVAILATLKSGCAYLPIDPQYPADRKEYVINDARIEMLITDSLYMFEMDYYDGTMLALDIEFDPLKYSSDIVDVKVEPNDLAYIIYTSGSTGQPKGVMVEHANLSNLIYWQQDYLKRTSNCNVLQYFSYSFDGAVGETFWTLATGSTLCMYDHSTFNAPNFYEYIKRNDINVFVTIPSFIKLLDPEMFKAFEDLLIVVVGEVFDLDLAKKWSDVCMLVNGYGPTENTVYSTVYEIDSANGMSRVPIGKPITNTKVYVLDQNKKLVPKGVAGELYVSGNNVAKGYLNREKLTNEKFIADIFNVKYLENYVHPVDSLDDFFSNDTALNRLTFNHNIEEFYGDTNLPISLREKLKVTYESGSEVFQNCFIRYLNESKAAYYSSFGFTKTFIGETLGKTDLSGLSVLDLGFGNGELLDTLHSLGADVSGVDVNPYFVNNQLDKGYKVKMARADLPTEQFFNQTELEQGEYDVVFMTLLLDRLEFPKHGLETMFALLKEDGKFCLQTLLPIIPFDDGEHEEKIHYTEEENTITDGIAIESDKLQLLTLLQRLGGSEMTVRSLDYFVKSTDGNQKYTLWSFSGIKNANASYLYRTGDLGRWLPDGNLDFMGRIDDMVKIRGHRIELGEIETVLNEFENVHRSIVLVKEDNTGSKELVAYVASKDKLNNSTIQKMLSEKLPDYMVPKVFIYLDEMPLTQNGKVDKKALPAPSEESYNKQDYIAPETEIEIALVKIWEQELAIENIGVKDNFFELGGNSLKAIKIIQNIRRELNIDLEIKSLFDSNTISDLAFQIDFSLKQDEIKSQLKNAKQLI